MYAHYEKVQIAETALKTKGEITQVLLSINNHN